MYESLHPSCQTIEGILWLGVSIFKNFCCLNFHIYPINLHIFCDFATSFYIRVVIYFWYKAFNLPFSSYTVMYLIDQRYNLWHFHNYFALSIFPFSFLLLEVCVTVASEMLFAVAFWDCFPLDCFVSKIMIWKKLSLLLHWVLPCVPWVLCLFKLNPKRKFSSTFVWR